VVSPPSATGAPSVTLAHADNKSEPGAVREPASAWTISTGLWSFHSPENLSGCTSYDVSFKQRCKRQAPSIGVGHTTFATATPHNPDQTAASRYSSSARPLASSEAVSSFWSRSSKNRAKREAITGRDFLGSWGFGSSTAGGLDVHLFSRYKCKWQGFFRPRCA